ncbi:MAG: hydrogenase nickel incorporation protein HypB [Coriobacteriia bacterium]|nr:hydrogenase nickel incorporation protein HypB [Coriobacteriia bacterium]MCL2137081.1 hydrogenase nickel incorporation protein HypB [Coriobacteriia bacterium]
MQIEIDKPILEYNQQLAEQNRMALSRENVLMINIMASPGAGKTSLILSTIERLKDRYRIAVIEGDIASDVDAQLVKAQGVAAVQINTGGACHLEAAMVAKALDALDLHQTDLVIVENVGNLVCPVEFDLGENLKVLILSIPEGDDKPLKYPSIFAEADAILLNKIDAADFFDFDQKAFADSVLRLNQSAPIFALSAKTGEGLDAWVGWLTDAAGAL